MGEKTLLATLVVFLPIIFLSSSIDAARYKSVKALSSNRSGHRSDGSTSPKQSYLRIYAPPPKTVVVRENGNEEIECSAGGSPPPVIHWLKDGQFMPETAWNVLSVNDEENLDWKKGNNLKLGVSSTKSLLYLKCASLATAGEYTCVAENPYQRISSHTVVRVVPSARPSTSSQCSLSGSEKIPHITMWTDKRLEYMNGSARLYCRADGFPKPTIEWLETDGKPVTQNPKKYQVSPSGDLIIRNLKWSDMGLYVCIASNIHGSQRIETFLYPTETEKQ